MLHYFRIIKIKISTALCNFWIKCLCKFDKNIHLGQKCNFVGFTYFRPLSGSLINIGDNCKFNSFTNANLLGVNRNCMISTLKKSSKVIIGRSCGFSGTVIGCFDEIVLGENVKCGSNTLITDGDWHDDDYRSRRASPINIGNNVWLGEGVKILKGVTIGDNSLIGAGSVVTKNIPKNVIAAGNPCKVIKKT